MRKYLLSDVDVYTAGRMVLVIVDKPRELMVESSNNAGTMNRCSLMRGVYSAYLIDTNTGECRRVIVPSDPFYHYGYYKMQPFDVVDDDDHEF